MRPLILALIASFLAMPAYAQVAEKATEQTDKPVKKLYRLGLDGRNGKGIEVKPEEMSGMMNTLATGTATSPAMAPKPTAAAAPTAATEQKKPVEKPALRSDKAIRSDASVARDKRAAMQKAREEERKAAAAPATTPTGAANPTIMITPPSATPAGMIPPTAAPGAVRQ